MLGNNAKETLLQIKDGIQAPPFVSIFNNGMITHDEAKDVMERDEDSLNDVCSNLDYFLKGVVEQFARQQIDFDSVDLDFLVGLIYKPSELGEKEQILETSKPLDKKVRYYTDNARAYKNGELVGELTTENMRMNYQGYMNFDKVVSQANKIGFQFKGPQSFEELKTLIESGEYESISMFVDLTNKKQKAVENHPAEEPKKKFSFFRR